MTNQTRTGRLPGLPVDPAAAEAQGAGARALAGHLRGDLGPPHLDALLARRDPRDGRPGRPRGAHHPGPRRRRGRRRRRRPTGWPASGPATAAGRTSWTASRSSTIFNSVWFRGLDALLTISLIACTVQRASRASGGPPPSRTDHVGDGFFEHAPQRDAIVVRGDATDLAARTVAVLKRHHYRVVNEDDGAIHLYADRFRWAPFGSLIGHLSDRRDPGRRDRRLDVRLPRQQLHHRRGLHRHGPERPGPDASSSSRSRTPTTPTPAPRPTTSATSSSTRTARRSPARRSGSTTRSATATCPSTSRSTGRPPQMTRRRTPTARRSSPTACRWPGRPQDGRPKVGSFTIPAEDLTVWIVGTLGHRRHRSSSRARSAVETLPGQHRRPDRPEVDRPGRRDRRSRA